MCLFRGGFLLNYKSTYTFDITQVQAKDLHRYLQRKQKYNQTDFRFVRPGDFFFDVRCV